MGLFSSTKKDDKLPPLEFPELPKSVPSFDLDRMQQMPFGAAEIKQAVSRPVEPFMPETNVTSEQPLFIKIDKYKDVVENLKKLRAKLGEAEDSLNRLNKLKEDEDRELSSWRNDLENVRNQLLNVDKNLFE